MEKSGPTLPGFVALVGSSEGHGGHKIRSTFQARGYTVQSFDRIDNMKSICLDRYRSLIVIHRAHGGNDKPLHPLDELSDAVYRDVPKVVLMQACRGHSPKRPDRSGSCEKENIAPVNAEADPIKQIPAAKRGLPRRVKQTKVVQVRDTDVLNRIAELWSECRSLNDLLKRLNYEDSTESGEQLKKKQPAGVVTYNTMTRDFILSG